MSVHTPRRVAVAMSGGLDSAVAAALLQEQGYRVEGVTMHLWSERDVGAAEGIAAARDVCRTLGLPHRVLDLRQQFYGDVVEWFVREYACGRTPNPCLRCNRLIKFGALRCDTLRRGIDTMATGHYARVDMRDGRYRLRCGRDPQKDQSYFLYGLGQGQLSSLLFPLGEMTKAQVRHYAHTRGLRLAERAESQDICFLAGSDYRLFVRRRLPGAMVPGPILAANGQALGQHRGLPGYTIGQREGLGIAAPEPLYVTSVDWERNAIVVGSAAEATVTSFEAEEVCFVSGQVLPAGSAVQARIRYRAPLLPAVVWPCGGSRWRVALTRGVRGIAPGQAVVFYSGDDVLGGGLIARSLA